MLVLVVLLKSGPSIFFSLCAVSLFLSRNVASALQWFSNFVKLLVLPIII
jgi:hypothetical protein